LLDLTQKLEQEMKTITAKPHPEAVSGEIFLSNAGPDSFEQIGWKTKRRGETPYDVDGKVVQYYVERNFRPVFVQVSELQAAGFKIERTSPKQ
jgi:hypothetical protein